MSTLKLIKNRIRSLKATEKITSAMKMVAASKYKRQDGLFHAAKQTHTEVEHAFQRLGPWIHEFSPHPFFENSSKNPTYIVLTPEKGLCGGLTSSILRRFHQIPGETPDFYVIGHKGILALKPEHDLFILDDFQKIERFVKSLFKEESGPIFCVRPVFHNVLTCNITVDQLFPLIKPPLCDQIGKVDQDFISPFLHYLISSRLWMMMLELSLCEHSSRMIAMDQASRNARTFMNRLQKIYHTSRQAQITKELIEIVAGSSEMQS